MFWPNFEEKKQAKKGILKHFLENFDKKKQVFSARAPTSKLIYIGAEGINIYGGQNRKTWESSYNFLLLGCYFQT